MRLATEPGRRWLLAIAASVAAMVAVPAAAVPPCPEGGDPVDPVVLVPGFTGVKLRDRATGRVVWGRGIDLLRPHDGGYATALPLTASDGEAGAPSLEAFEVIERVRLAGVFRSRVYGPLVRLLESCGYRRGDLEAPDPSATLFLFVYDWRRDLSGSAARLLEDLHRIRRARGAGSLEVALLCQSGGALICRYLAKYGNATLAEAEAGAARPPEGVRIAKLVLIGTSNGGGLRILRELDRGRRYIRWIGRRWRPETLFTFPSLFQDLPVYRDELFVDEEGRPLPIDLFDAATWQRYGWSIFAPRSAARAERRPDLFGEPADRLAALERMLDRGRRLHRLLRQDVDGFSSRYYSLQNRFEPTPERAVLARRRGGGWRLLFTGDRRLERRGALRERATAPGDGHATLASQLWLSPQERDALSEPLYVRGTHFGLIHDPAARRRLLEILAADAGP